MATKKQDAKKAAKAKAKKEARAAARQAAKDKDQDTFEATPEGDAPEGDAPEGDAPEGDAPEGDAPEGDAPEGDAPSDDGVAFVVGPDDGSDLDDSVLPGTPKVPVSPGKPSSHPLFKKQKLGKRPVGTRPSDVEFSGLVIRHLPGKVDKARKDAPCPCGRHNHYMVQFEEIDE
jgi:hypothetical protein